MFTVYLMAVLCGVVLAAFGGLVAHAVAAAVKGEWKQAGLVAALAVAVWFLPVNATFWTVFGLTALALVLLAAFLWVMSQSGNGTFWHWYGCWKVGECLLECLGVVLGAVLQALADANS